jgi:hypothetical protein
MASWRDVHPRVEALEKRGLVVNSAYRGAGLPGYLAEALKSDVYVLNAKDVSPDDTLCVVRLSKLEQLITAAAEPTD